VSDVETLKELVEELLIVLDRQTAFLERLVAQVQDERVGSVAASNDKCRDVIAMSRSTLARVGK
jgi:hypothetical protein